MIASEQALFRTETDTSATAPVVVRTSPVNFATGVPQNVVLEAEFNEELDPLTVNSTNVTLFQNTSGSPVISSTVRLVRGGRVIRIVPDAPLLANTRHFFDLATGITDLDGSALQSLRRFFFTPGDTEDNAGANVVSLTPPDGASDVGVNANIRARFDEPINPLTITASTILVTDAVGIIPCTISFSNNNQDVLIVPHNPLKENDTYSIKVPGVGDLSEEHVEDLAGNIVRAKTTQFTTGAGPDTTRPQVVRTNPFRNATGVPVNTAITLEVDEPIDPSTVNGNSFRVMDNTTGQIVAGSLSVSGGGHLVNFVPDASLPVGRSHRLFFSNDGILDLAGNRLFGSEFSFTTSFADDTTGPQVVDVSPEDNLADVPTNARVVVEFDEPLQTLSIDQVKLNAGGVSIEVIKTLSNGNT